MHYSGMLRVVLVGVLSLSAVGCKSKEASPKAQPGVAAGKVLEVTGSVTVRHADVARPLASGDSVDADDTIETGADGHVLIELVHNNAKWDLGANKKQVVRESLAWKLAKNDGTAKPVDQDTAAAGRPAERSAAESGPTADRQRAAEVAPAAPQAAPPPPPPAAQPPAERKDEPKKEETLKPPAKIAAERKPDVLEQPSGGGAPPPANAPAPPGGAPAPAASAYDLVVRETHTLKKCLTGDVMDVSLTITINAQGTPKVTVNGSVPAKVTSCVTAGVKKIKFAKEAATVKLQISR